jgi:Cu/Ag efflux protein CusF
MNKPSVKPILLILALALSFACGHSGKSAPQKHYALTGKVVSLNAKDQTAAIDAAAVKGYMEAMTMDYPIQSKDEFAKLHAGDHITATIDVSDDGSYTLSHIKIVPPPTK